MCIDHDTYNDTYRAECDHCHHSWLFEGYEIILEPWPHFECPRCGEWIPLF